MATNTQQVWYKVLDLDELPEGRVVPKPAGVHSLCMTHFEGEYAALMNKCPHQGGPLGEGSIENGLLRCPWHGYQFDLESGECMIPESANCKLAAARKLSKLNGNEVARK